MKLRSSKAAVYAGMALVMCLMPVVPVLADSTTTYEQQQSTQNNSNNRQASFTVNVTDIVATGYQAVKETGMYADKAIAIADPYIEVYSAADENSEITGRLYTDNIADVIEINDGWTKIQSGSVTGYVKTATLCFDSEAGAIASDKGDITATVTAGTTDVLTSAYSDTVLMAASEGTSLKAVGKSGNYIKVVLEDGKYGYVLAENVAVNYGLTTGITNEQVQEKEAQEEAARQAAEAEAARVAAEEAAAAEAARVASAMQQSSVTYNPTMSVSDEDIWLLATVIDWESGWESYEGKLAVANVVLNRVRSPRYDNTISGVIYARSQFSGVSDGYGNPSATFAARLAAGPRTQECIDAALEALSGVNNVGSYTSFLGVSIANYSAYSSYMVIGGHCFH